MEQGTLVGMAYKLFPDDRRWCAAGGRRGRYDLAQAERNSRTEAETALVAVVVVR